MPDAVGECLIVETVQPADADRTEGSPNRGIAAFREEVPAEIPACLFPLAEHGRKGQKTEIDIVVVKLLLHAWVGGQVDEVVKGVKEKMVFRKPCRLHRMSERPLAAPVII